MCGSKPLNCGWALWTEAMLGLPSSHTLYMCTGKADWADREWLWGERDDLWQWGRSSVDTDPVQCPWKRQRGNTRNGLPKSSDFLPLMDWCFSSTWKVIISLYLLRFTRNNKKLSPLPRSCFVPFNLVFLINGTAIPVSHLKHNSGFW